LTSTRDLACVKAAASRLWRLGLLLSHHSRRRFGLSLRFPFMSLYDFNSIPHPPPIASQIRIHQRFVPPHFINLVFNLEQEIRVKLIMKYSVIYKNEIVMSAVAAIGFGCRPEVRPWFPSPSLRGLGTRSVIGVRAASRCDPSYGPHFHQFVSGGKSPGRALERSWNSRPTCGNSARILRPPTSCKRCGRRLAALSNRPRA